MFVTQISGKGRASRAEIFTFFSLACREPVPIHFFRFVFDFFVIFRGCVSFLLKKRDSELPWSNMDHLFRPKSTDPRCLCIKMSIPELSSGFPGFPGFPGFRGSGGSNCSSDLPSTRVRVLHMTVVDVTNSLKTPTFITSMLRVCGGGRC